MIAKKSPLQICLLNDIVFSGHNRKVSQTNCVIRVRPNPMFGLHSPFDPENDADYKTVLVYPDKVSYTEGRRTGPSTDVPIGLW